MKKLMLMLIMAVMVFASAPAFAVMLTTVHDFDMSSTTGVGGTLLLGGSASISGGLLNLNGTGGTFATLVSGSTLMTATDKVLFEAIFTPSPSVSGAPSPYRVFQNGLQAGGSTYQIVRPGNSTGLGASWNTSVTSTFGGLTFTDLRPYAVALVRDQSLGSNLVSYFNDGLAAVQMLTGGSGSTTAISGNLWIGAGGDGTNHFFNGTIDRVRFSTFTGTWDDATDRPKLLKTTDGTAAAAVPEPSTFVLAGLGLLGLGCVAQRRNRRRG